MKIVVDDKIPYISEKLTSLADEVVFLPGSKIGPGDVCDADALIVRTRTRCDEYLLKNSTDSIKEHKNEIKRAKEKYKNNGRYSIVFVSLCCLYYHYVFGCKKLDAPHYFQYAQSI